MNFHTLPTDVYTVIKSYLSPEKSYVEYRNLLNTNKAVFSVIKWETINYDISCKPEDICHLGVYFNNVRNSLKQVRLSVKHGSEVCEVDAVIKDVMEMFPQGMAKLVIRLFPFSYIPGSIIRSIVSLELIDLPEFSRLSEELIGVETLALVNLPKLVDISGIAKSRNIKSVRLNQCSTISNLALSLLNGIREVSVGACHSVTDINYLGNHESLHFWSSRGQVTTLKNLNRCKNLHICCEFFERCDYSDLENVSNKLSLFTSVCNKHLLPLNQFDGTSLTLSGFELINSTFLRNCPYLRELNLSHCKGIDIIDFQINVLPILSLKSLLLYDFGDIVNTNSMGKIKEIRLSYLSSLVSLGSLGVANRNVWIINLPQVIDFSPLQHVRFLLIADCINLTDVSVLKNVKFLSIGKCFNVTDVSGLDSAEYLSLSGCHRIRSLKGVKHIKNIVVYNCESLENIDELKGRRDVVISDCPKVK
jgi:urease gamma subunit